MELTLEQHRFKLYGSIENNLRISGHVHFQPMLFKGHLFCTVHMF